MIQSRTEPWPNDLPQYDEVASSPTISLTRMQGVFVAGLYGGILVAVVGSILTSSGLALSGLTVAALSGIADSKWLNPKLRQSFQMDCARAGLSADVENEIWYKTMEE